MNPDRTETLRKLLRRARSVCVLTGAGMSAESGIPTFRGPGGLWRNFRPEELATARSIHQGSQNCLGVVRLAAAAHCQSAAECGHMPSRAREVVPIVTQNVDETASAGRQRGTCSRFTAASGDLRCMQCGNDARYASVLCRRSLRRCECGGAASPRRRMVRRGTPHATSGIMLRRRSCKLRRSTGSGNVGGGLSGCFARAVREAMRAQLSLK